MLSKTKQKADVVIVGGGHNGLVSAVFLARKGLDVVVLEEKEKVGGAVKTEYPFARAPGLGMSTGAYLLGVMPPELLTKLGLNLPLVRRDPHYFLPTMDRRYLLFGSDQENVRRQFLEFFSEKDWQASEALNAEIAQLREDLAPSWLEEPLPAEQTAAKYVRPALRKHFLDLLDRPIEEYLDRFGFESQLLLAMYAVTDGFTGLNATFGARGAGFNFLAHNMCRLPGSEGTWMICKGGMGTLTRELARLASEAGARIQTGCKVEELMVSGGSVRGVRLQDGREIEAPVVVSNADPFRTLDLVGRGNVPTAFAQKVDGMRRDGSTLKVNMALKGLPKFKCLPEARGQHTTTIHLLPQEEPGGPSVLEQIKSGYKVVREGGLADFPTIEWYIHTEADPSLRDSNGYHNSAFFVQWVPYELKGTTWEQEESRYVQKLLKIADQFAPGTSDLVVDTFTLTPPKIEKHFGITRGHIHHVDNTLSLDQRMPYATPVQGLYACSAGCHPAGAVVGAAGHNSAHRVLKDLGFKNP
jgi:phytoene dehydrogenase-like protein